MSMSKKIIVTGATRGIGKEIARQLSVLGHHVIMTGRSLEHLEEAAMALIDTNIVINSMCPAWVKTDMGGPNAHRELEKGAETAVWLSTEAKIPEGKFIRDKKVIAW